MPFLVSFLFSSRFLPKRDPNSTVFGDDLEKCATHGEKEPREVTIVCAQLQSKHAETPRCCGEQGQGVLPRPLPFGLGTLPCMGAHPPAQACRTHLCGQEE